MQRIAVKGLMISVVMTFLSGCYPSAQGMYQTPYYPGSTATGPTQNYCPKPRVIDPQNAVDIVQDSPIPVPLCGYPA